tara:strand:+ start:2041 stop:2304 length:264 start_codon:yes stop_codon:yes gene_type:complete
MPIHNLPITISPQDEDKIFYKVLKRMIVKKRKHQKLPYGLIKLKVDIYVMSLIQKICDEEGFVDTLDELAGPIKNTVSICEEQDELA